MQEEGVGWDPVSINRPLTPLIRVYILFLFLVLAITLFRTVRLVIQLRRSRKFDHNGQTESDERLGILQHCAFDVHSLKRWSGFTLRASVFVALFSTAEMVREVTNGKMMGIRVLGGSFSEICIQFAVGIFVVLVANAAHGYFEGALEKRSIALKAPINLK